MPVAGSLANRTVRPSRNTGCTSGVPGSRPSVNSRFNGLKAGGPASRIAVGAVGHVGLAAERGFRRVGAQAQPEHVQLGPLPDGQRGPFLVDRVEQRAAGLPGLFLVDQEGRPGRQVGVLDRDGRRVAPGRSYSKLVIAAGSTQPVPVVPATSRYARSKPPARSRSATASRARSSTFSADSIPAYARIGSGAVVPEKAAISAAVGPCPTKLRPWYPRVSQATSEPGPPDRNGVAGWTAVSLVVASRTEKIWSVTRENPVHQHPADQAHGQHRGQHPPERPRGPPAPSSGSASGRPTGRTVGCPAPLRPARRTPVPPPPAAAALNPTPPARRSIRSRI